MSCDDEAIQGIASEIMQYFDEFPGAADTAEWIWRWWLVRKSFDESGPRIQEALDCLVDEGLVRRQVSPGMPPVYSLARSVT